MILDNFLLFTGTSNGSTETLASGANTDSPTTGTQVSANVVDLGLSGIPTSANGGGARDIGIGDSPALELLIQAVAAFTDGTSLAINLQGAPDNGSGAPGSWTTMWTSGAIIEANLDVGAQLANVTVPMVVPGQPLPRFLRLQYVTVGTHVLGTIVGGIVLDRFDTIRGADSALSGYQAGINVAN